MTVYALRLENAKDTAGRVRMGDLLGLAPSSNLGARGGIRPGPTAANVAVTAGTMNVTVQPFLAWVDGGVGDTQGGYPFVSDAVVTLTLANGHGSLSRTDVVCAVVRDNPYDSSGSVSATVEVVQGTAGAGSPTLPTNCVPLRNVVVPAGASTGTGGLSSGALSTDRRTYLAGLGGIIPVASQAERDALPGIAGLAVYRKDTDTLEVRGASAWREYLRDFDTDLAGAPATGSGWSGSASYVRRGGTVTVNLSVGKTTWAGGETLLTFPAGFRPLEQVYFGAQALNDATHVPLRITTGGALITVLAGASLGGVVGSFSFPV